VKKLWAISTRRSGFIAPIAVSVVLLIASSYAITRVGVVSEQHHIAHAAANVRAELSHLAALENGAEAGEPPHVDELSDAIASLDRYLPTAVRDLPDDETAQLSRDVNTFAVSAERTALAYHEGNELEADDLDDETTDPLFHQLNERFDQLLVAAEGNASDSARAATQSLIIASVISALTVLVVVGLEGRAKSGRALTQARVELAEKYRSLIENSPVHVFVIGADGSIDFMSPGAEALVGRRVSSVTELLELLAPDQQDAYGSALLTGPVEFDTPKVVRTADKGRYFEVVISDQRANPAIEGMVLTARDITERTELEQLLRQVAARLTTSTRRHEFAARLGGDEFAVLMEVPPADTTQNAELAAGRILDTLREPYVLEGQLLSVSASIGIALASEEDDGDALLRHADIALYEAKRVGGGRWTLFEPGMEELLQVQTRLQRELQTALEDGDFSLAYQPLVSVADGRPTGFEALVRWQSPHLGEVSPATFIPATEQSGLIVPLGQWVLRTACKQLAEWQQEFADPSLNMSVNASVVELLEDDYTVGLIDLLEETGLEPGTLQIEVTESILANDGQRVIDQLHHIRCLGVKVALDDFGTGYSSMSQLQALPVDCLKIDQAFIRAMPGDQRATRIVRALTELGSALGLTVVAEGVERSDHLDAITGTHCDLAQGYLFSHPIPANEVPDLMTATSPTPG
jgi:PAS domain S-box-containing protein